VVSVEKITKIAVWNFFRFSPEGTLGLGSCFVDPAKGLGDTYAYCWIRQGIARDRNSEAAPSICQFILRKLNKIKSAAQKLLRKARQWHRF